MTKLSPVEQFLVNFHDKTPGLTSLAYKDLSAECKGKSYRSSYESLADAIPHMRDRCKVLDVACGDGYLLSLLQARAEQRVLLHGVDISRGELSIARERLGREVVLVQCRAQSLPMAAEAVDCVVSHMALMLMDDLDGTLAEIRRVLRRGGTFAFVVGASPPQGQPVIEKFIARVRSQMLVHSTNPIRIGDPRMRSEKTILSAIDPYFSDAEIVPITLRAKYSVEQVWSWFNGMYEMSYFDEVTQQKFGSEYIDSIRSLCAPDKKIELVSSMIRVTSRAR